MMRALYQRLPEGVRRCLRPLNLVDEVAALLPGGPRARMHGATEATRRLARLGRVRFPLRRLAGPARGSGARLVCLVAADELSTLYWKSTLFAAPPADEVLEEIPALRVPAAARRLAGAADLSFWQTPWPVSLLARTARVPSWLPLWLATDRPLDDLIAGERSDAPRARTTSGACSASVSRSASRPTRTRTRCSVGGSTSHTSASASAISSSPPRPRLPPRAPARLAPPRRARRQAGRRRRDRALGRRAARARLRRRSDAPIPTGAVLEACYYHAISFAVERGFDRLSLGTCRPVLTDGVLRYKRKWGGRIGTPATWDAFLLRYRNTPAVRDALTEVPLVLQRRDGHLAALVGVRGSAGTDLAGHVRRLEAPGLSEVACLVDATASVGANIAPRHVALRIVPPGEVWPAEAAA
jgi:hypothetical protein